MTSLTRRILWVAGLVAVAIGGAFAIEVILSVEATQSFGHTQRGHLTGWAGLAIILLVFIYPFKKRYGPKPGWPKGWFQVHIVAGVVGPVIVLVHSGAHFHALVPGLALLAMGLVVLSGVAGESIHYLALRTMHEQRRELAQQGLPPEEIDLRLHDIAAREEAFRVWQYIHAPLNILFVVLSLMHVGGALYFGGV